MAKKKGFLRILLVLCMIIAILWFPLLRKPYEQWSITRIVEQNSEELTQMAEEILAAQDAEGKHYKGVEKITYWDNDGTIFLEFFCRGFGIVPSSSYKGFYYSPDDIPLGYQGADIPLTPSGRGWRWEEADGDNRYFTEQIRAHWFYYEMHF